nr:MAG TPA: hypothetical protein [Caudoviricetes sp.]
MTLSTSIRFGVFYFEKKSSTFYTKMLDFIHSLSYNVLINNK